MQRILVVEDDLDTAQTFAIMLREMGHQVVFAINGRAALEVASNFRPDTVFVDMLLPDMDGSDLARQLRALAKPEELFVVAVTGVDGDEVQRRAMLGGCNAFLRKPVDRTVVDRLLAA
ncbi:MAG: response regulator [Burkholderiales bacterium]